MRAPICAVVLAALPIPLTAQEEFDRLYDIAEERSRTDPASPSTREAWAAALYAFLQIPADAEGYTPRLLRGGRAALGAGRNQMALELVAESIARQGRSEAHLAVQLRVLIQLDDAGGFLAAADGRFPAVLVAELQQDWASKLSLLGWADQWLRSGRTEDGLWLFRQLARTGDPADLGNLALALRHAGLQAESERTYELALDAAPDDPVLWNDYGLFLKGVGRPKEAVAAFRQSYTIEPRPGEGPAITNLLVMALLHPDLMPTPPLDEVPRAFAVRRESGDPLVRRSEMLRRVTLDLLLDPDLEPFPASDPDRAAIRR